MSERLETEENTISQESNKPGPPRLPSFYGEHCTSHYAVAESPCSPAPVRCSAPPTNHWDPSLPAALPEWLGQLRCWWSRGAPLTIRRFPAPSWFAEETVFAKGCLFAKLKGISERTNPNLRPCLTFAIPSQPHQQNEHSAVWICPLPAPALVAHGGPMLARLGPDPDRGRHWAGLRPSIIWLPPTQIRDPAASRISSSLRGPPARLRREREETTGSTRKRWIKKKKGRKKKRKEKREKKMSKKKIKKIKVND